MFSSLAILGSAKSWHVAELLKACSSQKLSGFVIDWGTIGSIANSVNSPEERFRPDSLHNADAILVRTMPTGTLEQVIARMDILARLSHRGSVVLNNPKSLETAIDKYVTTTRLIDAGVPVPPSAIVQSSADLEKCNVQFGGDGRRIIKSGGGNVGAGSGTGGGKNQNIIGIPKDPYFGGSGVGSGLTSSFAGTAKLGTTFKPQPLVIPKAKTQDKKVKKTTTTTSTSSKSSTGPSKPVKKGPASTSTKPMEGLISLGGSEMVSKIKKTVDAARSSSNDLIKNNLDGGGRVGRVRRRQQKRTANLEKRLQNRAEIKGIRQSERGKRQGMRESASQERKNLLMDNPVAKDASGGRKSSQPQQPKATQESKMSRKTKRQLKRSNKFSESLSGAKNKNLKSGGSQDFRGMKGDKSSNKATFDYSGGKNKYKKNAKI